MSNFEYYLHIPFAVVGGGQLIPPSSGSYTAMAGVTAFVLDQSFAPIEDDEKMYWSCSFQGNVFGTSPWVQLYDQTNTQAIVSMVPEGPIGIQGPIGTLPSGRARLRLFYKGWNGTDDYLDSLIFHIWRVL